MLWYLDQLVPFDDGVIGQGADGRTRATADSAEGLFWTRRIGLPTTCRSEEDALVQEWIVGALRGGDHDAWSDQTTKKTDAGVRDRICIKPQREYVPAPSMPITEPSAIPGYMPFFCHSCI